MPCLQADPNRNPLAVTDDRGKYARTERPPEEPQSHPFPVEEAPEPDADLAAALAAARERGRRRAAEILAKDDTLRADGRPYAILPKLHEILGGAWAVYRFLVTPQGPLGGRKALDALKRGQDGEVVAVAESVARAARMCIAQQALSAHIQALEKELGVRLLERSTRRVELTRAGEVFYDRAVRIIGDVGLSMDAARSAPIESSFNADLLGRFAPVSHFCTVDSLVFGPQSGIGKARIGGHSVSASCDGHLTRTAAAQALPSGRQTATAIRSRSKPSTKQEAQRSSANSLSSRPRNAENTSLSSPSGAVCRWRGSERLQSTCVCCRGSYAPWRRAQGCRKYGARRTKRSPVRPYGRANFCKAFFPNRSAGGCNAFPAP